MTEKKKAKKAANAKKVSDKSEIKKEISEWKKQKEELSGKVVDFAKNLCKDMTDTKIRSVISGAYFQFNKEFKNKK